MARGARAIVDISQVALQFPAIVDYFPERDREDAVVLTELRSRSIGIVVAPFSCELVDF